MRKGFRWSLPASDPDLFPSCRMAVRKPKPKVSNAERHKRFVAMAREVGATESSEAFDRASRGLLLHYLQNRLVQIVVERRVKPLPLGHAATNVHRVPLADEGGHVGQLK